VTPLHDTRQFPDVLMTAAQELGGKMAAAFPQGSYLDLLKANMRSLTGPGAGRDFEEVWAELLRQGGLFRKGPDQGRGYRWTSGADLPEPDTPRFLGSEKEFPLHLHIYPSTAFYDGRGAPLPWLQHLPDPMSTVVWDSWIEINPETAKALGIGFGDLVEVTSPRASLQLPAVIYPGIRPDMAAIPLGQGHRDMGRYAKGRGVNPLALLAMATEGKEPVPAWNATRVRIKRISEKGGLVVAGHPEGSYRSDLIEI
jgi:anaerobic selenocysteine-containing dehydrogenase